MKFIGFALLAVTLAGCAAAPQREASHANDKSVVATRAFPAMRHTAHTTRPATVEVPAPATTQAMEATTASPAVRPAPRNRVFGPFRHTGQ